jgi:two-component system, cell cycle response regulator DivK
MPATIIVLENDAAARELMCYLLTMYGHSVHAVGTPEAAQDLLGRDVPDLIISDLQLGRRMDGYAFGSWCRKQDQLASVPLVCVTASWEKYNPDKIESAGFTTLIPKPINAEAFVFQVEFYLPATKRGRRSPAP